MNNRFILSVILMISIHSYTRGQGISLTKISSKQEKVIHLGLGDVISIKYYDSLSSENNKKRKLKTSAGKIVDLTDSTLIVKRLLSKRIDYINISEIVKIKKERMVQEVVVGSLSTIAVMALVDQYGHANTFTLTATGVAFLLIWNNVVNSYKIVQKDHFRKNNMWIIK